MMYNKGIERRDKWVYAILPIAKIMKISVSNFSVLIIALSWLTEYLYNAEIALSVVQIAMSLAILISVYKSWKG